MADDLKELIIQQLNTETIELNEGKYHTGKAEIIRFIGKKLNK